MQQKGSEHFRWTFLALPDPNRDPTRPLDETVYGDLMPGERPKASHRIQKKKDAPWERKELERNQSSLLFQADNQSQLA